MLRNDLLCWMDLEMTSLGDARTDQIIEIAAVLTDANLTVVAEGPDIVIHADRTAFDRIPESARTLHENSGVLEASVASTVTEEQAAEEVLAFLKQHIEPQSAPLGGNTIYMDRYFLRCRMPAIDNDLFYRCVDVSTLKELARRWRPEVYEAAVRRKGTSAHRAKDDIMASIEELRFYRGSLGL